MRCSTGAPDFSPLQVGSSPLHSPLSFDLMNPTLGISISLFVGLAFSSSRQMDADKSKSLYGRHADSAAVVQAASRFHSALERGDTSTISTLLARDLLVLESGEIETREQYFAHHLGADIEFARSVRGTRRAVSYTREGNVAWLVSTSTASGNFNGRDINSAGAELMILSRSQKGWQIRAVHWSSTRRQQN